MHEQLINAATLHVFELHHAQDDHKHEQFCRHRNQNASLTHLLVTTNQRGFGSVVVSVPQVEEQWSATRHARENESSLGGLDNKPPPPWSLSRQVGRLL